MISRIGRPCLRRGSQLRFALLTIVGYSSVLTLSLGGAHARAGEVCGLQNAVYDGIFADGFDVPSGGLGPAYASVDAPTIGIAPEVSITSPGGNVPGGHIQVRGTVTGPPNVGVVVNGERAYVHGGTFLTPEITLDAATTQLLVTATAPDGLSSSATQAVSVTPEPDAVLVADADAGFAALPVRFTVRLREGLALKSLSIDFQTDGSTDYAGAGPIPPANYAIPGIYTATATITLADDSQRIARRQIIALDLAEQRSAICLVYANLRAGMAAQNAERAAYSLTGALRSKLLALFGALGAQMPPVGAALGTLADGMLGLDTADVVAVKQTAGTVRGYPIHFVRDAHGVWRIDAM